MTLKEAIALLGAFMSEQVAKRMGEHIQTKNLLPDDRIFALCYSTARSLIRKLGRNS